MNTRAPKPNAVAQAVLEEARQINEERLNSVEALARLVAERSDLKQRLKENAKDQRQAIREAKRAGWTAAQIKRFMKPPMPTPSQNSTQSDAEIAVL